MNVINLWKNDFNRILEKKAILIVAFIVIPILIAVSVLFTGKEDIRGNIAFVSYNDNYIPKDSRINVDVLTKAPPVSSLLLGKYIAIVENNNNGNYKVITLKNDEDKEVIEKFFKTGKVQNGYTDRNRRGPGTNILGFILMIILMQGIALIILYIEDRDIKTFRRILTTLVNVKLYLFSKGIFTFLCLYIPSYVAIILTNIVFNVNIGFNYEVLAILIAILSALSTSLALFFASVFESNYSLIATSVYVITSIFAGCYVSISGNNKIFNYISNILPQKVYLTICQGIENGKQIIVFTNDFKKDKFNCKDI